MIQYNYEYDVFLSHASEDEQWTKQLAERLRDDGFQVFFDLWSIAVGEDFSRKIEQGLRSSYKTVFVMTPESIKKEWPEYEARLTRSKDLRGEKRKLLPLLLKDCEIPEGIQNIKHINFTQEEKFEENYKLLVAAIIKDIPAMQLGPCPMLTKKDRENFIDRVVKKIELFFGYPEQRLFLLNSAYDELTENAFNWGSSSGKSISVEVVVDNNEIYLKVQDWGKGIALMEEIKNAKEFIQKNPSCTHKRGLLRVLTSCDGLYNVSIDGTHTVTAIIKKADILTTLPEFKLIEKETTSQYSLSADDNLGISLLRVISIGVDTSNYAEFEHVLRRIIFGKTKKVIIVDLTQVQYITSKGWGVIIDSGWEGHQGEKALIIEPNSAIRRNFNDLEFGPVASNKSISIFETIDEVLAFYQLEKM